MAKAKYQRQHQLIRKQLLPLAYGQPCHLCGLVMQPDQTLDLDHTPDGTGYRGMTHARCNRSDGGKRAHQGHGQPSRRW